MMMAMAYDGVYYFKEGEKEKREKRRKGYYLKRDNREVC